MKTQVCLLLPLLLLLHGRVKYGSTIVLEHILSHEECDVDPQNRIDRATPLHVAAKLEHQELRHEVLKSLLDAGADMR